MNYLHDRNLGVSLPIPDFDFETPCFVINEDAMKHNLRITAELAGGVHRLAPHVKTHRAPWVTEWLIERGVTTFKAATPREVEMIVESGAKEAIWAYPTTNASAIERVVKASVAHPEVQITALVDDIAGLEVWKKKLAENPGSRLKLRVDLDPGLGRTGIQIGETAIHLALKIDELNCFGGWHVYDGHIKDLDLDLREKNVLDNINRISAMLADTRLCNLTQDLIGGGSYTYPIWAKHTDAKVGPGSWIYSSSQHHVELKDQNWQIAAYLLSTVVSERAETATLDAGSKAIAPDMPINKRFSGVDTIVNINEEHAIVIDSEAIIGDVIALIPRHACTTAYLHRRALVLTSEGDWVIKEQLGCER